MSSNIKHDALVISKRVFRIRIPSGATRCSLAEAMPIRECFKVLVRDRINELLSAILPAGHFRLGIMQVNSPEYLEVVRNFCQEKQIILADSSHLFAFATRYVREYGPQKEERRILELGDIWKSSFLPCWGYEEVFSIKWSTFFKESILEAPCAGPGHLLLKRGDRVLVVFP